MLPWKSPKLAQLLLSHVGAGFRERPRLGEQRSLVARALGGSSNDCPVALDMSHKSKREKKKKDNENISTLYSTSKCGGRKI